MRFIKVHNNEHHGYLDFLKQGLVAFPYFFKLSPDDEIASNFPSINPDNGFTLGLILEDKLVGVISFTSLQQRKKLAHIGEVSRMYVSTEVQGRQLGYHLLSELIDMVRREFPAVRQLKLNVATENHKAKSLYDRLGFRHVATEKDVIRIGGMFYDDDMMTLTLSAQQDAEDLE